MDEPFYLSDSKDKLQLERVMALLGQTYWANERSEETVRLSIENSLCFGAYLKDGGKQIAFVRVITDFATAFYLCDVIVDQAYRGLHAGKELLSFVVNDARLKGLMGFLATRDAHGLYERFGFRLDPTRFMRRLPQA